MDFSAIKKFAPETADTAKKSLLVANVSVCFVPEELFFPLSFPAALCAQATAVSDNAEMRNNVATELNNFFFMVLYYSLDFLASARVLSLNIRSRSVEILTFKKKFKNLFPKTILN